MHLRNGPHHRSGSVSSGRMARHRRRNRADMSFERALPGNRQPRDIALSVGLSPERRGVRLGYPILGSALVDRSLHLFARQRHIEMSDTERCQSVDDRVDHCRDRTMSTGLTDPFRAELIKTSRQRLVELGTDRRQVVGARHGVVEKGPAQQLAGFGIVDDVFEQGLADALRHAAVHLSVGDKRVDDSADVVHCDDARVSRTAPVCGSTSISAA